MHNEQTFFCSSLVKSETTGARPVELKQQQQKKQQKTNKQTKKQKQKNFLLQTKPADEGLDTILN